MMRHLAFAMCSRPGPSMPVPATIGEFLEITQKSGIADWERITASVAERRAAGALPDDPKELAQALVDEGLLTYFQADQLLQGKWRGFSVGKYQILERIGSGGMGVVYLAEHKHLLRRVAIKVLPVALAQDPWFLEHFYREAQAIAALDHPNIVHAHDIDREGDLHFLVMEYVDGNSLQVIVFKNGPMEPERVAHYLSQAASGLQHAHEAGLVHRDIKPANLLLERHGVVKILDMGLAHFLARVPVDLYPNKDRSKRILGTDDYLAPEQIVDSDDVDVRADIYSLGATAYFMLTGKPPFHEVAIDHHKLMWHLMRSPRPIRELRPEVPEELAAVVNRMMAKNPWERYQFPAEVVEALRPWTQTPIPPPPEEEMPGLSLAARRSGTLGSSSSAARRAPGRSSWVVLSTGESGAGSGVAAAGNKPLTHGHIDTPPPRPRPGNTLPQPQPKDAPQS